MLLSLVCLTTPLTIIRRALNATFRTTDREESLSSWAAPFVIAENEVSCSFRHPLVLQDSCIFRRSRIQRQPSPVVAQVARSPSRSSQRSRANSEHRSLHDDDVPKRERPRSNSNLQKRQPVTFDEDVPPLPSHARTRALTTASSSRNTSTPPSAGECYRRWSA